MDLLYDNAKKCSSTTVEYHIFLINDGNSEEELTSCLQERMDDMLALHSDLLINYIWQLDSFNLSFRPTAGTTPAHLYGCTDFGDFIEDEWLIVWLLLQLTDRFEDLVIQVSDGDGDFLLIEAADHLPAWLKPETSCNRVYLYQNELHIIPLPRSPADMADFPGTEISISSAITCLQRHCNRTRAASPIQQSIRDRIKGYPQLASTHMQRCNMYLPAPLSALLRHKPQLVASAVQAFCQRSQLDLQACRTFQHFRPGDRVMCSVVLNRCQYAQLRHQQFTPDKRSGYTLPSNNSAKFKPYDLGAKLAHGFEILVTSSRSSHVGRGLKDSVCDSPRWQRFVSSLTANGYFKSELEGSVEYQRLLSCAQRYFTDFIDDDAENNSVGADILRTIKALTFDLEEMKKEILPPEDGEQWMEISEEDLTEMMCKSSGLKPPSDIASDAPLTHESQSAAQNAEGDGTELARKVVSSMRQFVQSSSTHDGAEFPNGNKGEEIEFDSKDFLKSMRKLLALPEIVKDEELGATRQRAAVADDELKGAQEEMSADESSDDDSDGADEDSYLKELRGLQEDQPSMSELMYMMDNELNKTEIAHSFERSQRSKGSKSSATRNTGAKNSSSSTTSRPAPPSTTSRPTPPSTTSRPTPPTSLPKQTRLNTPEKFPKLQNSSSNTNSPSSKVLPPRPPPPKGKSIVPLKTTPQSSKLVNTASPAVPTRPRPTPTSARSKPQRPATTPPPPPVGTSTKPSGNSAAAPIAIDEDEFDCDLDSDDSLPPVDVDLNAVKNLLASVSAQEGEAGPAGNILQGMGLVLPPDSDNK